MNSISIPNPDSHFQYVGETKRDHYRFTISFLSMCIILLDEILVKKKGNMNQNPYVSIQPFCMNSKKFRSENTVAKKRNNIVGNLLHTTKRTKNFFEHIVKLFFLRNRILLYAKGVLSV